MTSPDKTNPFSDFSPQESQDCPAGSSGVTAVGTTLLGLAVLYIFLMLTNLVVYVPMIFEGPDDASFPIQMCVLVAIVVAYNLVLITGAISILRRGSYIWSYITCCLAMLPVLGPCWLLGIPIGIWGIVQLSKPGVRESFTS